MAKATIEEGNITVQVPTKTIERAKQQFLKVFDIKNLRGLTLFFGLGEAQPFNIPTREVVASRARKNALFFATNYAVSAALVTVLAILFNPFFLFILICLGGSWFYIGSLAANETPENPMKILGRPVSPQQRRLGMSGLSIAVVIIFGGSILITVTMASSALAASHAVLRDCQQIKEEDELGFLSAEGTAVAESV